MEGFNHDCFLGSKANVDLYRKGNFFAFVPIHYLQISYFLEWTSSESTNELDIYCDSQISKGKNEVISWLTVKLTIIPAPRYYENSVKCHWTYYFYSLEWCKPFNLIVQNYHNQNKKPCYLAQERRHVCKKNVDPFS